MVTNPGKSASQREDWLEPALDYILQWLEYQMRETEQPGCVLALVHDGRVVLGTADSAPPLSRGVAFEDVQRRRDFEAARTP